MQLTEETSVMIIGKFVEHGISGLRGFPKEDGSIKALARAVAKIVRNQPIHREDGRFEGQNDLDWLLETVHSTQEWCPAPIKFREIYSRYFPPEDHDQFESLYRPRPAAESPAD